MTRIGIPQGLLYYEYGRLWESFLRELGLTVVLSGQTTQAMMDYSSGLDELCLPAKVFIGHCVALREQVDLLLKDFYDLLVKESGIDISINEQIPIIDEVEVKKFKKELENKKMLNDNF